MQKMENKLEDKNRFKIIWNVQEKKNPKTYTSEEPAIKALQVTGKNVSLWTVKISWVEPPRTQYKMQTLININKLRTHK